MLCHIPQFYCPFRLKMSTKEIEENVCDDDFHQCPWVTCDIQNQKCILKYSFMAKSYKIMVLDFENLYYEELNEESLLNRSKALNSNVEISVPKITKQLQEMVGQCTSIIHPPKEKLTVIDKTSNMLELKLISSLSGVPFEWRFSLTSMEPPNIFIHVIQPLLSMTVELQRRNCKLISLINLKDREIEDYKANGSHPSKKYLETDAFKETEFADNMDKSLGNFDVFGNDVSSIFQDKLFCKVASMCQSLLKRHVDGNKTEESSLKKIKQCTAEINTEHISPPATAADADTDMNEEIARRNILYQQLDSKEKKKPRRKPINL